MELQQQRNRKDALRDFVQIQLAVLSLQLSSDKSSSKIAFHMTFVDFRHGCDSRLKEGTGEEKLLQQSFIAADRMESLRPQHPKQVGHESFLDSWYDPSDRFRVPAQTIDYQRKARLAHEVV